MSKNKRPEDLSGPELDRRNERIRAKRRSQDKAARAGDPEAIRRAAELAENARIKERHRGTLAEGPEVERRIRESESTARREGLFFPVDAPLTSKNFSPTMSNDDVARILDDIRGREREKEIQNAIAAEEERKRNLTRPEIAQAYNKALNESFDPSGPLRSVQQSTKAPNTFEGRGRALEAARAAAFDERGRASEAARSAALNDAVRGRHRALMAAEQARQQRRVPTVTSISPEEEEKLRAENDFFSGINFLVGE